MKLKAPADLGPGISVGGQYFAVDKDGCIEVPEDGDYSMLVHLGFAPYVAPVKAAAKPKED